MEIKTNKQGARGEMRIKHGGITRRFRIFMDGLMGLSVSASNSFLLLCGEGQFEWVMVSS